MTHLLEFFTLGHPVYRLSGLAMFVSAFISAAFAILLWRVFPVVAGAPSPAELEAKNTALEKEISARQELEARLTKANELLSVQGDELKRSKAEVEQYAYLASHDLREPLRAVTGCAEILQFEYKGKLDAQADELLEHAVDGSKRMQALIADLLAYSRLGKEEIQFEAVNTSDVLAEVRLNLQPDIHETGASINSDDLPVVWADRNQLLQLFQNLLGNAIKFHGPEVPVIYMRSIREGDFIHFSVADNGIGIDSKHFDRIFVLFQRLHTRREYSGTGVGLAVCKKIVEFHKGQIWVESQSGKGSTFHFTIACAPSH
jgi:light-regulated signal transduction histidine kinase (bacteriophytochrome)